MRISTLLLLWGCTGATQGEPAVIIAPPAEPEIDVEDPVEVGDWPDLPQLDEAIEAVMADAHIPGLSACIIREAELAWCGGYGWANIDDEIPVETDTPFMLASISKLFTGTALMLAWEEGLFELDDPISEMVDFSFTHPDDDTPITARQLLSHTGGVRDNWDVMDLLYVDGDSPIELGDFVADYYDPEGVYYHESRNWVPEGVQEKMVYANMGYAMVGHLVEVLSGESFPDWCEERIFRPLEMDQTSWHMAELDESTVAMPYIWSNGDYRATGHYGYPDYPDGGLRTGAEQLARFMAMGMGGGEYGPTRVLEEDSFVEMLTIHYPELDPTQGLGWYNWKLDGEVIWGHDGGDLGVATEAGIRWSDELGFVILMNGEGTRGDSFEILARALLSTGAAL